MTWAKHHAKAKYDLTGSNLLPCSMDELPGARDALEIYGRNDDGWPPLVEAIASRFGVATERVATAPGASGANYLALAALVRPGDTVLVEWPGYDPHMGAARFLGANVTTFQRGWEQGFALDADEVAASITSETRAIVLTNLHNPSGAYAEPEALVEVGKLAKVVGAKVIVDEVYLDALEGVDNSPAATRDDVFISTNSLTKSYGLAGIRVGWVACGPRDRGTYQPSAGTSSTLSARSRPRHSASSPSNSWMGYWSVPEVSFTRARRSCVNSWQPTPGWNGSNPSVDL